MAPQGFCPKEDVYLVSWKRVSSALFETAGQIENFHSTVDSNLIFKILPPLHFQSNSKPSLAESFSGKLQEPLLKSALWRANKKGYRKEGLNSTKWVNCKYFPSHFLLKLFCTYEKQNHIFREREPWHYSEWPSYKKTTGLQYLPCSPLGAVQRGR